MTGVILVLLQIFNPCEGRVHHKSPIPLLHTPKPAQGVPFTDPAFGTQIRRLTNAQESEGQNAVIKPMYSTFPACNSNMSRMILWHRGKGHELWRCEEPYDLIRPLGIFSATDPEGVLWDPDDPNTVFYPTNYNNWPLLIRHTTEPRERVQVQHNFANPPTNCPIGNSAAPLSLSKDPQWMGLGLRKLLGLRCGDLGILYSINEDNIVAMVKIPKGYWNTPVPLPSEQGSIFDRYVFDLDWGKTAVLRMVNPYEHASLGQGAWGLDYWNAVGFEGPNAGSLVSWELGTGAPRVVIGPKTGWPTPPASTHISSIARWAPGWVAVGITGNHHGATTLDNEILMANVETGEVCRVGHSRTFAGSYCGVNGDECPWGYWSETHLNLLPDGLRVVFGSDWFGGKTVDTYLIDLRRLP